MSKMFNIFTMFSPAETKKIGPYAKNLLDNPFFDFVLKKMEGKIYLEFLNTHPKDKETRELIYLKLHNLREMMEELEGIATILEDEFTLGEDEEINDSKEVQDE